MLFVIFDFAQRILKLSPDYVSTRPLAELQSVIIEEKDKFVKTLAKGEKEFFKEISGIKEKSINVLPGSMVFRLYDTYGFPPEVTKELAKIYWNYHDEAEVQVIDYSDGSIKIKIGEDF